MNTVFMVIGAGARALTMRAFGQADLDAAEGALVLGQVGLEERRQRHEHRRGRVGDRAVLEAAQLRRGAGEVDDQALVLDRQRDGDPAVDRLEAVVVDRLPRRATRPRASRAMQARKRRSAWSSTPSKKSAARSRAQLLDQQRQPLGADAGRADHGAQVAVERLGQAGVEHQQPPQVVARPAAFDQLQHRQADAFVEDLGGRRIVGARRRRRRYRPGGRDCRRRPTACRRRTPAARSPSRADGCRPRCRGRSAGRRLPVRWRP